MAKEKARTEDTVKDIIGIGIDFRPQTVLARTATGHIIKPANFDGQFLVNATGGLTVQVTTSGNDVFDHALDRDIEGRIIVNQDVAGNITITSSTKKSVTLTATTTINAKIIIF